ncbi:putative transposase [Klebsiella pneumoniae subsp. pneumoniae BJ1-GA]|nr:putative transposase [Klebsiella pneumoniae subsp. pneumoniae BJ1-GA]
MRRLRQLEDENQRLKKLVAIRPTGVESAHPQLYPRNGHDAG